jgi:hypothetical protein
MALYYRSEQISELSMTDDIFMVLIVSVVDPDPVELHPDPDPNPDF